MTLVRVLTGALVLGIWMGLVSTAASEAPNRVVDVNFERFPQFDRLVVTLQEPLKGFRSSAGPNGGLLVKFDARPKRFRETLPASLPEARRIAIEQVRDEGRLMFAPGVKPIRIYSLEKPSRLVVDFTAKEITPERVAAGPDPLAPDVAASPEQP